MKYLSVKNLAKYQHYRERRPVWIKLYQSVLEDVAFTCLQDASKAHAMLIWLIASRYDNRFPHDAKWVGNAIHASEPVDLDTLIDAGFLVDAEEVTAASNPASKNAPTRKRVASPKRTENREQRTEEKAHGSSGDEPDVPVVPDIESSIVQEFDAVWALYPKRPSNPKRPALKAYAARRKAGIGADELLEAVRRYAAYAAAAIADPRHIMQAKTFFGPDERWTELYELPTPAGLAGSIATSPIVERARTLYALGKQYRLFSYNGNREEYSRQMREAAADARAGERFRDDAAAAKLWEGIGTIQQERYAVDEIVRRLTAAGVKVA